MSTTPLKDLQIDNSLGKVLFSWNSGLVSEVSISKLRGMCPCASCQGHGNAPRFINNTVKSIKKTEFVGRYALTFIFSDGHSTGIYSWEFLRQITELDT